MLTALLLLLAQSPPDAPAPGASYSGRTGQVQVALPRLDAVIEVDGQLDEPAWAQAARLTAFSAYSPVDGREADEVVDRILA